ncbi:GNAT family protein [Rhodococcus aerolatus]
MDDVAPLGEPTDFRGAATPAPVVLTGRWVRLEPVDPERHGPQLAPTVDDARYTYLPYGPFGAAGLTEQLARLVADPDAVPLAVCDRAGGRAVGALSLLRLRPEDGACEVGHVLLGSDPARTTAATEAFSLLAHHVFDELGMRRYEWKCDTRNAASQRAARRLGFVGEGVFRQDRVVKGRNRDTAWFSVLDTEWPVVGAAYRAWLDDANQVDGAQRRTLEQVRADLSGGAGTLTA